MRTKASNRQVDDSPVSYELPNSEAPQFYSQMVSGIQDEAIIKENIDLQKTSYNHKKGSYSHPKQSAKSSITPRANVNRKIV